VYVAVTCGVKRSLSTAVCSSQPLPAAILADGPSWSEAKLRFSPTLRRPESGRGDWGSVLQGTQGCLSQPCWSVALWHQQRGTKSLRRDSAAHLGRVRVPGCGPPLSQASPAPAERRLEHPHHLHGDPGGGWRRSRGVSRLRKHLAHASVNSSAHQRLPLPPPGPSTAALER
jgi:hypothetical protein